MYRERDKLRLLEFTKTFFKDACFDNILIVCIQHLLPTTYDLFETLCEMGVVPEHLFVLGKCYSSDPQVVKKLREVDVQVDPNSEAYNSHLCFDEQFDGFVEAFLSRVQSKVDFASFEKVVILDDGGHLLEVVAKLELDYSNFVGIEQTSAGFNRTKHLGISFPIVNLARAWAKIQYETPMIIETCLKSFEAFLANEAKGRKTLLFGNGVIGSRIQKKFHSSHELSVFDLDPGKSQITADQLPDVISSSDLILGSTGATSLSKEMHELLKPTVTLASLSSSDREFDAVHLRKKLPTRYSCYEDLKIGGITLLNSGFPINFRTNYHEVDPPKFAFTRSLILASLVQAISLKGEDQGYIDLDDGYQSVICDRMKELVFEFV